MLHPTQAELKSSHLGWPCFIKGLAPCSGMSYSEQKTVDWLDTVVRICWNKIRDEMHYFDMTVTCFHCSEPQAQALPFTDATECEMAAASTLTGAAGQMDRQELVNVPCWGCWTLPSILVIWGCSNLWVIVRMVLHPEVDHIGMAQNSPNTWMIG